MPPSSEIKSADHTLGNTVAPQPMTARLFSITEDEPPIAATTFQAASLTTPQVTAPVAPNPIGALVALPGTLLSLTTNLISAALAPFLVGNPAAPADPPLLWGLLAWVRRQFERTFFNSTPTLAPQQTSLVVDADGTVRGTLGPPDADGDELTYWTTSDPAHGTVSIDQVNRTWTYTPDAGYRGPDSFTVKVSDEGFHIHGLLGFLQPDFGDTASAVVNVNVADVPAVIDSVRLHGTPKGPLLTSPDGKRAYQVTTDSDDPDAFELVVVNTSNGAVVRRQTMSGRLVENTGLVLSPDGTHAVLTSRGVGPQTGETNVRIIDLTDPSVDAGGVEPVATVLGTQQHAADMVFSADGKRAYLTTSVTDLGAHSTGISVYDIGTRQRVGETLLAGDYWAGAELNADGTRAFVETADHADSTIHHVSIIDSETGDVVGDPILVRPDDITFFAGPTLHTVHEYSGSAFIVSQYSTEDGHHIRGAYFSGSLAGLKVGPDGTVYYQSLPGGNVIQVTAITAAGERHELSPITGEQTFLRELHFNSVGSLAYLPTQSLQPNGHYETRLTIIDTSDFTTRSLVVPGEAGTANGADALVPTDDHTRALLFTTDFDDATAAESLRATAIDLENGRIIGAANTLPADRVQARFSPDGKVAYLVGRLQGTSGATEQTVISRLDMTTGNAIGSPVIVDGRSPLSVFDESPFQVSADGTPAFVVTRQEVGQQKSILTIVDLQHSRVVGEPIHADGIPYDLVTNADGSVAVFRTTNGHVTVVDSEGRRRVLDIDGPELRAVAFTDDGQRLYLTPRTFDGDDDLTRVTVVETTTGQFNVIDTIEKLGSPLAGTAVVTDDGTRLLLEISGPERLFVYDTGAVPVVAPPPVDPATPPNLIELALNQIQRVFFNQTPTLTPVQHTVVMGPDGTVVGTLGAHDGEADQLRYTVTGAPAHGTVTIDQATGTWTYTPNDGYVGPDSFTVEASDATSLHLHGPLFFAQPDWGYTASATVNINAAHQPSIINPNAQLGGNPVGQLVFSTDGKHAYQLTENDADINNSIQLVQIDTATGGWSEIATVPGQLVDGKGLVLSGDRTRALAILQVPDGSGGTQTVIRFLDLTTTGLSGNSFLNPTTVPGGQSSADQLVMSRDGMRAYLTTQDHDMTGIAIIDLANNQWTYNGIPGHPDGPEIQETPDGARILRTVVEPASGHTNVKLLVLDTHTGEIVKTITTTIDAAGGVPSVDELKISADGTRAFQRIETSLGDTIVLVDPEDGGRVKHYVVADFDQFFFVGNGSRAYLTGGATGEVVNVIDTADGLFIATGIQLQGARDFESTDDGTGYYLCRGGGASGESTVMIIGTDGSTTRISLEGSPEGGNVPTTPIAFNATGTLAFVTTGVNGTASTPDSTIVTVIDTRDPIP
jgi:hypothetical protein